MGLITAAEDRLCVHLSTQSQPLATQDNAFHVFPSNCLKLPSLQGFQYQMSFLVDWHASPARISIINRSSASRPVRQVLAEELPALIASLKFRRNMRWRGDTVFSRPLRWLLALHGPQVIFLSTPHSNRDQNPG